MRKKTLGYWCNVTTNEELWKIIDKEKCLKERLPVEVFDKPPRGGEKVKYWIKYYKGIHDSEYRSINKYVVGHECYCCKKHEVALSLTYNLGQHLEVSTNEELWKIIDKEKCIEFNRPYMIQDLVMWDNKLFFKCYKGIHESEERSIGKYKNGRRCSNCARRTLYQTPTLVHFSNLIRNVCYFIWEESDDNLYKIGFSTNFANRIQSLQGGTPRSIHITYAVSPKRSAKKLEKHLHKKFDEYRFNGEWFKFDDEEQVKEVIKIMNEYSM